MATDWRALYLAEKARADAAEARATAAEKSLSRRNTGRRAAIETDDARLVQRAIDATGAKTRKGLAAILWPGRTGNSGILSKPLPAELRVRLETMIREALGK